MFGRLAMSACAGQRTSGEASGRVWWSSSRTDWNHGHGCSHGIGASQPKQQGSTVQLLNIISSPVPLSACGVKVLAEREVTDAQHVPADPVQRLTGQVRPIAREATTAAARDLRTPNRKGIA